MKARTRRSRADNKKTTVTVAANAIHGTGKPVMKQTPAVRHKCNHCGGLIKYEPDEAACVMCGRRADHYCPNCLYAEKSVA